MYGRWPHKTVPQRHAVTVSCSKKCLSQLRQSYILKHHLAWRNWTRNRRIPGSPWKQGVHGCLLARAGKVPCSLRMPLPTVGMKLRQDVRSVPRSAEMLSEASRPRMKSFRRPAAPWIEAAESKPTRSFGVRGEDVHLLVADCGLASDVRRVAAELCEKARPLLRVKSLVAGLCLGCVLDHPTEHHGTLLDFDCVPAQVPIPRPTNPNGRAQLNSTVAIGCYRKRVSCSAWGLCFCCTEPSRKSHLVPRPWKHGIAFYNLDPTLRNSSVLLGFLTRRLPWFSHIPDSRAESRKPIPAPPPPPPAGTPPPPLAGSAPSRPLTGFFRRPLGLTAWFATRVP